MLDDANVIKQRDPEDALGIAAEQWQQVRYDAVLENGDHDAREITKVIIAGMGGSALAGLLAKALLEEQLVIPFEVVREYELPTYVDASTLVIASSYSGNTEETISSLEQAQERGAQIAVLAAGGKLIAAAKAQSIAHIVLPSGMQPRMAMLANLRALVTLLAHFGVVSDSLNTELAQTADWLHAQTQQWLPSVSTDKNEAKQLALLAVGKTPVIYGGRLTGPLAYKWKISWNENAKNVAFWDVLPEFNHNEFIGWSSHPIDKPFVVFDLISSYEHPRIRKRFDVSDRLLSGLRPKANQIHLPGDTALQQLLGGCILADYVSIYVAILNGVDPTPVVLVEKFKDEMAR